MNAGWAACSRGRFSTSDKEPSSFSQVCIFPEKMKKVFRLWRQKVSSYKRSSGAIIMSRHVSTWKSSKPKIPVPKISGVHQLKSFDTILGLLGKSVFILVLPRGCSISWMKCISPSANFERILYPETCQQQTISPKNIQAS